VWLWGVRLTWLFFLILTKLLPDEKILQAGGQKASVARSCNEADCMGPECSPLRFFSVGKRAEKKRAGVMISGRVSLRNGM